MFIRILYYWITNNTLHEELILIILETPKKTLNMQA